MLIYTSSVFFSAQASVWADSLGQQGGADHTEQLIEWKTI